MGATCLTVPSCALTWAPAACLTNLACRSWDNGSSSVVGVGLPDRRHRRVRPGVSRLRRRGCAARQRHLAATARAAGVAPDMVADHDSPLPLHRLWASVAPGHQPSRPAADEAVGSRAAAGASRHRVSPVDLRSGVRGRRRVVAHRERRWAGRGQACVNRGPAPVRRGCWKWSRADRSRCSRPNSGSETSPGATASRWLRWTGSPVSRPPPARSCPTRSR
jgi:hypothetical protein